MAKVIAFFILLFHSSAWAYKLTIIQGVSRTGQTFITRMGKKDGIVVGKKATFNTDNVSFIAKAISVSREFTQWEIENQFTDVPFKRGDIITYYDTTEHLWALAPEEVMSKYIKTEKFLNRKGIGFHSFLTQSYNEAVSGVTDTKVFRGGFQAELMYEQEINKQYAFALGGRFTKENIVASDANLISDRVIAMGELRYYFDQMPNFYYARGHLSIGLGYGQSQTTTTAVVSSGSARVLPQLKAGLNFPINLRTELVLEGGIEAINIVEEYEDKTEQVSNINHAKVGIGIKRYLNI